MKRWWFVLLLVSLTTTAWAAPPIIQRYVIQRADGSLAYLQHFVESGESLNQCVRDAGFEGRPIFGPYAAAQLPLNEPVEFWKLQGSDVVLDVAKKQQAIADQTARDAKITALRNKLKAAIPGLTDEELDLLKVKKRPGETAS